MWSDCLDEEQFAAIKNLSDSDKAWLKAHGWVEPHQYFAGCVTANHCGSCEPCNCDWGLYV